MRNALERDVEVPAVSWAKAQDILHLKGNRQGNTGWPDQEFFLMGRMVFVEFKRPGSDLKRNQPERCEELVARGFTVGVFDDLETFKDFMGATLLSGDWRRANDLPGVCWVALQARSWENQRGLYGVPYLAGERIRR
jgi:hypothetical protein